MKIATKKILSLSIVPSIVLINGCASSSSNSENAEVINVSDTHLYNEDYGLVPNPKADEQLRHELIVQQQPVEVEIPKSNDPTLTTELKIDPDTFTAENYTPKPPVITYKYMDDPIFYTANEIKEKKGLMPFDER